MNQVTPGRKAQAALYSPKICLKCDSSQRCFPLLSKTTNKAFVGLKSLLPVCLTPPQLCVPARSGEVQSTHSLGVEPGPGPAHFQIAYFKTEF